MSVEVMRIGKGVGKTVFAALFILGGVGHFLATDVYIKIMPPYLPYHRALVLLSGVFEVALGLLLEQLLHLGQFGKLAQVLEADQVRERAADGASTNQGDLVASHLTPRFQRGQAQQCPPAATAEEGADCLVSCPRRLLPPAANERGSAGH